MLSIKCGLLLAQLATGTDHFTDHAVIKGDKVDKDGAVMIFNSLLVSAAQHINKNTAVTDDYTVEVSDEDFKRLVFGSTSTFVATLKNGEFYVDVDAKELRLVVDKEIRHIVSTQLLPQFADWLDMKLELNATKQSASQSSEDPDFGAYVIDTDLGIYEPGLAKTRVLQEHKRNESTPLLPANTFQKLEAVADEMVTAEKNDLAIGLFEANSQSAESIQQHLNNIFLRTDLSNVLYMNTNIIEGVKNSLSQHLESFGSHDEHYSEPKNPVDELFAAYGAVDYATIPMQLRKIIELAMSVSLAIAQKLLNILIPADPNAPKSENMHIYNASALLGLACFPHTVDHILKSLNARELPLLHTVGAIPKWDNELRSKFAETISFILKKRARNLFIDRFNTAFIETLQFYGQDQVVADKGVDPSKYGHHRRNGESEMMVCLFDLPCYRNIVTELSILYVHVAESKGREMSVSNTFEDSFGGVLFHYPTTALELPDLMNYLVDAVDVANFTALAAYLNHDEISKTITFIGTDVIGRYMHNEQSKYRHVWEHPLKLMREQVCKEIEIQINDINDSLQTSPTKRA